MDGMMMEMNEAMLSLLMGRRRRGSETFRVISFGCCRLKLSGFRENKAAESMDDERNT
jgi:hypothetical protein